jgi:hypothetical protein
LHILHFSTFHDFHMEIFGFLGVPFSLPSACIKICKCRWKVIKLRVG